MTRSFQTITGLLEAGDENHWSRQIGEGISQEFLFACLFVLVFVGNKYTFSAETR